MRFLTFIALCFLAASCGGNNDTMTRYHEDGRAKPIVAVASMIDTTSFDAPWSISEELTSMVVDRIGKGNQIFIETIEDCPFVENPFGNDLSWIKREFPSHEFVVFLELVEHETTPATKTKKTFSPQEISLNLNMAVRIRVLDLRGSTPEIVLQETVRDSYFIPKTLFPTDYRVTTWGTEGYPKSPMGIAHSQLTQEIVHRLSDYILLAKSR